ncbi:MAG: TonB-dependent siderophore receptor [Oceanicaulis sp.]
MRILLAGVSSAALLATLGAPAAHAQQAEDQAESTAAPQSEDVILVTGRAQALYRVGEIEGGKLPVEPLLSTQTIQVISEQLIEDQGARDASDLYRNLSGVSVFSYAGVTARGFRQEEIYFDGLRGDPYAGFSVPQLFNVARVEYLKGPSGMLYGPGAPGGLFNYVTKKPGDGELLETSAVIGTEGRYGASAEIERELSDRVSARGGVFYEEMNLPRRNADSETLIFDAGLGFDLGRGELVLQATRYDQDLGGNRLRGVPTDDLGNFLTDRRWNHNEASDFLRLESDVLQATVDYALTDDLVIDAGLRWNEGEEVQQYHEPRGLFDFDGDGAVDASVREFRDQIRTGESLSFGANAIWSNTLGPVDNRLLAGVDWFTMESDFTGFSLRGRTTPTAGLPTPLSLFNPQYGVTDVENYALPPRDQYRFSSTEQNRAGVYLLNEATLGDFIGVFGVRRDRFEDTDLVSGDSFEDEATTLRAGLIYRVQEDISLFAQWAESFEPQSIGAQSPLAGGPFDPEEGEIYEAGVRTELMGGRIQSSASVYEITRTNVLQADPRGDVAGDGVDDFIAFGEVTSEGFEFDVTADITPNWVGTASYAWNDTRITADNGSGGFSNAVGDKFANAPEHTLGFWTRYQFPQVNTAIAFGGDYVDVRRSISGQKVRPYIIFDASLIYETDAWRAVLRADNLFDETYAASGFIDRTGHFPGAPRSVFLEVTRRW